MARLARTIIIKARAETVFRALDDPNALPLLYNCVCNVTDFRRGEKHVGDTFKGTFSVIGVQFDVVFTCAEHEPPRRIIERLDGAMKGSMVFELEEQGSTTSVTLRVECEISRGLLGKIVDKLLFTQVAEKNAERILENLSIVVDAMRSVH